jgi:hypothetical protein
MDEQLIRPYELLTPSLGSRLFAGSLPMEVFLAVKKRVGAARVCGACEANLSRSMGNLRGYRFAPSQATTELKIEEYSALLPE